jgi:hypothetical protein
MDFKIALVDGDHGIRRRRKKQMARAWTSVTGDQALMAANRP